LASDANERELLRLNLVVQPTGLDLQKCGDLLGGEQRQVVRVGLGGGTVLSVFVAH
jgi:hypothetical protein